MPKNLPPPSWFAERADDFKQTTGQHVSDADPEVLEEYHARVTHPSRAGEFTQGGNVQRFKDLQEMKDLAGGTTEQRMEVMDRSAALQDAARPAQDEARRGIARNARQIVEGPDEAQQERLKKRSY